MPVRSTAHRLDGEDISAPGLDENALRRFGIVFQAYSPQHRVL